MNTATTIRTMTPADLPAVLAIEQDNFQFPWTLGIFNDCLNAGYACVVMEIGKQLVGYAVQMMVLDEAHLLNISIAQDFQRQGWGRHLLLYMMELGRQHDGLHMFLEVRASNAAALALYQAMGFNEMGVRPGYYPAHHGREDAVLMGCAL